MVKIAVIIGSTRPGRVGPSVAQWVYEIARERSDAEFELVDIAAYDLPLFDEPQPPVLGQYTKPHTLKWAETIDSFDGYVFVTPEYNHAAPGALKNALDYLYREWNDKSAGFVSYGSLDGVRAVAQLRPIMAALKIADVRAQVGLSLITDFENWSVLKPAPRRREEVNAMLTQVIAWAGALKALRVNQ